MNTVERFLSNTLTAFTPKRTFTPEQVKAKLEYEIRILEQSLFNLEPDTKTYKEKSDLLYIKRRNLEEVEKENL